MSFIQATLQHLVSCNNGSEQPSEGANCVCCDATVANWEQKKDFRRRKRIAHRPPTRCWSKTRFGLRVLVFQENIL